MYKGTKLSLRLLALNADSKKIFKLKKEATMSKRFNKAELYELRNFIPIEILIENELMIPSKRTTSGFKFQCVVCNEFQTAINPSPLFGF